MSIHLKWQRGTPKTIDIYFVAVELGPLAGTYDLADWDGQQWDHPHPDKIVAFIRFDEFTPQLGIAWPNPSPELPHTEKSESTLDFSEMEYTDDIGTGSKQ